jgi:hypothetical protein
MIYPQKSAAFAGIGQHSNRNPNLILDRNRRKNRSRFRKIIPIHSRENFCDTVAIYERGKFSEPTVDMRRDD